MKIRINHEAHPNLTIDNEDTFDPTGFQISQRAAKRLPLARELLSQGSIVMTNQSWRTFAISKEPSVPAWPAPQSIKMGFPSAGGV
ncbi:MAG: hypothetical protein DMG05_09485 [Acidobacteria bacterium]|nr:MAG: hypothetical protein DMG05_09485 [Acidobacteriota bacterium]